MAELKLTYDIASDFARGYVECALWLADSRPPPGPWEATGQLEDMLAAIDYATLADLLADAADFEESNADDLAEAYATDRYDASRAGHDFFLTRNGHGAGFWDRGLGDVGERLSSAARVYGSCDVYVPGFSESEDDC